MPQVDYYAVLELEKGADMDQVKEAYRRLAKKYHPDVNTTGKNYEPNSEKFRQIAEAYAVLSVPENKMSYDSTFTEKSEAIFAKNKSETMKLHRENRERSGHVPTPQAARGSYAEYRLKQLEKERKMFNVNHLGYYNGGLPFKKGGNTRGNAMGPPGTPHNSTLHNQSVRHDRESHHVNRDEARDFRVQQNMDRHVKNRITPYYTLEEDKEWKYVRNRTYATFIILGLAGMVLGKRLYTRERKRAHRTDRLPDNLEKLPSHHFVNRGGVIMKKEFLGFAKYFKNDQELTKWYNKVYPEIMKPDEQ